MTDNELLVKKELDRYFGGEVCAVFGILGNIKAESNCRGDNLQNSYEKKLGFTDETYTAAIDNGSYTVEQFKNDHAGYGLCQWTFWSRKQGLYDYWKEYYPDRSISYIPMQVAFLYNEISTALENKLLNAQTVEETARIFMLDFEKPANQSEENIQRRCQIARDLYMDYLSQKYNDELTVSVPEDETKTSKKELAYDTILTCIDSFKVYLDILKNAIKDLGDIPHD